MRRLRSLLRSIADLTRALGAALLEHSKAQLLGPMPGIGEVNVGQMAAEPILEGAIDLKHPCAGVGATPVTKESSKGRAVNFRWAVNTKAPKALFTFPDNTRHTSPWAAKLYADARARRKRHPHAIPILMRASMCVIRACWHTNTEYNSANHDAERRLAQPRGQEVAA